MHTHTHSIHTHIYFVEVGGWGCSGQRKIVTDVRLCSWLLVPEMAYPLASSYICWILTCYLSMISDSIPDCLFHKRPAHWLHLASPGWHREQDRVPSLVLGPSSAHPEAIQPHDAGFRWCRGVLHFRAWGNVEGENLNSLWCLSLCRMSPIPIPIDDNLPRLGWHRESFNLVHEAVWKIRHWTGIGHSLPKLRWIGECLNFVHEVVQVWENLSRHRWQPA